MIDWLKKKKEDAPTQDEYTKSNKENDKKKKKKKNSPQAVGQVKVSDSRSPSFASGSDQAAVGRDGAGEHQGSVRTVSGRTALEGTSYSAAWAVQSTVRVQSRGSFRQRPPGRERLEGPKSVRSKTMTRSLDNSCMCIADTPMLGWRSSHCPPPDAVAGDTVAKQRKKRRKGHATERFMSTAKQVRASSSLLSGLSCCLPPALLLKKGNKMHTCTNLEFA
ncbi:hypothetical protein C4D60_Mb01t13380 [Musa balbisiana]|uniref:Uncharacterized protein n=1 Tax=Musa balbisiana TaxID=52838 RepID=A0A4S8JMU7_MUSBA|nr:hypothetical protein C4D60_Mb01t13380 [Musa balbisiana]